MPRSTGLKVFLSLTRLGCVRSVPNMPAWTRGYRLPRYLLGAIAALAIALALLAPRPAAPGHAATGPVLTIFLIDGLEHGAFERELAAGKLPNMAALIHQGTRVTTGISAFPSMTGYGYYGFLT